MIACDTILGAATPSPQKKQAANTISDEDKTKSSSPIAIQKSNRIIISFNYRKAYENGPTIKVPTPIPIMNQPKAIVERGLGSPG